MSSEGAIRTLHGATDSESSRSVRDLIAAACASGGKVGMRIVTERARGHLFFEAGRIVHAEFGEDMGIRALRKMLRAERATLMPCTRRWPSERTLFLAPDKLDLSPPSPSEPIAAEGGADAKAITGVVRRVHDAPPPSPAESGTNYSAPPPLPDALPLPGQQGELSSKQHTDERGDEDSALSVSSKTNVVSNDCEPELALRRSTLAHRVERARAEWESSHPLSIPASPKQSGWRYLELPPDVRDTEVPPNGEHAGPVEAGVSERARDTLQAFAASALESSLAIEEGADAELAPEPPACATSESASAGSITTMVRLSERGELLAARGEGAEQLADVMALIHSLSKAIAADLGRHGRVSLHASGGGRSLLVTRTETRDLAGALGSTQRLSSLLRKAGFS